MTKTKNPKESEITMREMIMPGDNNARGTVFGGKIMSWMDLAAAMCAERHCEQPVVTVHISDIDFIAPLKVGYHAAIYASMNYVGNSSMVIGVRVDSENPYTGEVVKCTKAYLTFVALDQSDKPTSVHKLKPESSDEIRRYENAKKRLAVKKELRSKTKS
jgi:acyl-CoA hydrolase